MNKRLKNTIYDFSIAEMYWRGISSGGGYLKGNGYGKGYGKGYEIGSDCLEQKYRWEGEACGAGRINKYLIGCGSGETNQSHEDACIFFKKIEILWD